mgnify:CR=1 FL=1
MIKEVSVKNFKCFEQISVDFKELNLFTGINGMGKSTLIQAILLLRQTYEKYNSFDWKRIILNGHYINLGTIKDIAYWYRLEDETQILIFEDDFQLSCTWNEQQVQLMQGTEEKSQDEKYVLMGKGFEYISAERLGPRRYYDNLGNEEYQVFQIGTRGEKAVALLNNMGSDFKIYKNMKHFSENSERLDLQVNAWMTEISPGIKINARPYFEVNLMGLRYAVNGLLGEESTNALNMGFGVSYVLPVIVALLKARKGDLVILENPEAHLHPRGQRRIGELVALAAANGVQIIMETHSDHILNGIRLAVKQGNILPEQINVNYFYQYVDEKGMIRHDKTSPVILEDGSLSNWPDGFFDEWDKAIDDLF